MIRPAASLPWEAVELPERGGYMIVTPPRSEVHKAIAEGRSFTRIRVALLESNYYSSHEDCRANAEFIVRACNDYERLHDACTAVLYRLVTMVEDGSVADCPALEEVRERLRGVLPLESK